jgi:hypothetical protein
MQNNFRAKLLGEERRYNDFKIILMLSRHDIDKMLR